VAAAAGSQKATVIEDEASVYKTPDFDSPIIGTLKRGQVYDISTKTVGPFYKIRIRPGVLGYISDVDVKPGGSANQQINSNQQKKKAQKKNQKKVEEEPRKPQKPFIVKRYRGPVIEQINYTENTLGSVRSETLTFFGFKWSGFNTLFSGEMYSDGELLIHSGAPSYYKKVTGQDASGLIINANFLFETPSMQGRNHMLFYGFGPMFRYSQLNASVRDEATGLNSNYVLDDMVLGALFNLGLAFQLGPCALRSDVRYYIESRQYFAYGLSLQFDF